MNATDAKAREIMVRDLKAAIGTDVTIERAMKSSGDTQYRVSGILCGVNVDRGTVAVDVKRTGRIREIELRLIVKLLVWGDGAIGSPAYSKVRDQYEWMDEATEAVDGLVDCGCGTGKVTLDPKARGEGANVEHVHSEGHVAWILAGGMRSASDGIKFSVYTDDSWLGSADTIEEAIQIADSAATGLPRGESVVVNRIGAGQAYSTSGTKHREPKDTTTQALVSGQAYRALISGQPRLVVFSYAHVEDDDSLTLVFETATGREGWAEKLVESIEKVDASAEVTCGA